MDKFNRFDKLLRPARGLILDFDGFLADSEKYHFLAYREVFARHGHTIDEREYYKYWTSLGHGARGEINRHGLDLDPVAIRDEKRPIFTRYCEDGSIRLFDEVQALLPILARVDKKIAIASGSSTHDIEAVLQNAGARDAFDVVLGSDLVVRTKPHPDIFERALDDLSFTPEACVVFEDAEKGMIAAKAAEIPVVVVLTRETSTFDFSPADLVLDSHAELIEFWRRLYG